MKTITFPTRPANSLTIDLDELLAGTTLDKRVALVKIVEYCERLRGKARRAAKVARKAA